MGPNGARSRVRPTGQSWQESRPAIKLICQLFDECPSGPRPDRWPEFERGLTALCPSFLLLLLPPPRSRSSACLPGRSSNCRSTTWPSRSTRVAAGAKTPGICHRAIIPDGEAVQVGRRRHLRDVDGHPGISSPPRSREKDLSCGFRLGGVQLKLDYGGMFFRRADTATSPLRCVSVDSRGRSGRPRNRN